MKIYKITLKYAISKPVYIVCAGLSSVECTLRKQYKESEVTAVELVSDCVILEAI